MQITWKYCPLCKGIPNRNNSTWFDCVKCDLYIDINIATGHISKIDLKEVIWDAKKFERFLNMKAFW